MTVPQPSSPSPFLQVYHFLLRNCLNRTALALEAECPMIKEWKTSNAKLLKKTSVLEVLDSTIKPLVELQVSDASSEGDTSSSESSSDSSSEDEIPPVKPSSTALPGKYKLPPPPKFVPAQGPSSPKKGSTATRLGISSESSDESSSESEVEPKSNAANKTAYLSSSTASKETGSSSDSSSSSESDSSNSSSSDDSDSSDTSSASSSESSDEETKGAALTASQKTVIKSKATIPNPVPLVAKKIPTPAISSSSESDSDDDSSSESEAASKVKPSKPAAKKATPSSNSSSPHESASENRNRKKLVGTKVSTATYKRKTDQSSSSSEDSSSEDEQAKPSAKHVKVHNPLPTPNISPVDKKSREPSQQKRFQRVDPNNVVFKDDRLKDNSYKNGMSGTYADKASQDLLSTRGRSFKQEKNKKKRGSYKGGSIDTAGVHSIKFPSDSE